MLLGETKTWTYLSGPTQGIGGTEACSTISGGFFFRLTVDSSYVSRGLDRFERGGPGLRG